MKRVLLVSSNQERRPYPVPPLGLCLLAERLKGEFEVSVFDGMFSDPDSLRSSVQAFAPDFIGLGIRNVEDPVMERPRDYLDTIITKFVRPIRETTDATLIVGGSGFSLFPMELMKVLGADYGIVGEAEQTLPTLLQALVAKDDVSRMSGLVIGGETPRLCRPSTTSAEHLSIGPSRIERWLDFKPYMKRGSYPIQTKRGCIHRCVYCSYPTIEGRSLRMRRPGAIADELENIRETLGDVTFEFVDSIFNDPPDHAQAICKELIRRKLNLRLRAMGINPRGVTSELLSLMRQAGFAQMDCTPDSAAPQVLKQLKKGFSRRSLEEAALNIREVGIPTMWFLLFGGPGETEDTIAETLDFVDRFIDRRDMVSMWMGIRIYPRTVLQLEAIETGIVSDDDDLLATKFYVSPALGRERCRELIEEASVSRPNCVPAWEPAPDQGMLRQALALREQLQTAEPMFRTLIRLRKQRMRIPAHP